MFAPLYRLGHCNIWCNGGRGVPNVHPPRGKPSFFPALYCGSVSVPDWWTKTVGVLLRKNGVCVITKTNLCKSTNTTFPKYLFDKSVICKGTVWGTAMEKSPVLTVCSVNPHGVHPTAESSSALSIILQSQAPRCASYRGVKLHTGESESKISLVSGCF